MGSNAMKAHDQARSVRRRQQAGQHEADRDLAGGPHEREAGGAYGAVWRRETAIRGRGS